MNDPDKRRQFEAAHFHSTAGKDLLGLVLGDLIGSGSSRAVYEWLPDPTLVAKIEEDARSFSNVMEFEVWRSVEHTEFSSWFAPVVQISATGLLLLQKRTIPMRPEEFPDKVPAFLTDLHRNNWGLLDGRPVCHDYGLNMLIEQGISKRLRKVKWWGS